MAKKLKEQTKKRRYHAIPASEEVGDADRAMAFLEMVTGMETEVLRNETTEIKIEDFREWINPRRETSGRVQLDYIPTILFDKEHRMRVIRPEDIYYDKVNPCPIPFEGYSEAKLKDYYAKEEKNTPEPPQTKQEEAPVEDEPEAVDLTGIPQRYRLLEPTALQHKSWEVVESYHMEDFEVRTTRKCQDIMRYVCGDGKTGCDEIIADMKLLQDMKWVVRLKNASDDSLLRIPEGLVPLL